MLLQLLSIKIAMVALSIFEKCDVILGERVITCDNPCVKRSVFGIQTESRCGRILVCSWLLFSVVFASLYSSKLTSSLTISDQSLPFTSLSELVNQNVYTWGMRAGTASEAMVKNSTNEDYKKFYNGLLAFAQKDPSVRSPDDGVHLAKVRGENYAYFAGNELFCQANMTACSDLAFIRDDNFRIVKVFYLQKGSPYTKIISNEINRMVDMGLISFWKRKWLENTLPRFQTENVGQIAKPIMLAETQSAFILQARELGLAHSHLHLNVVCFHSRRADKR